MLDTSKIDTHYIIQIIAQKYIVRVTAIKMGIDPVKKVNISVASEE